MNKDIKIVDLCGGRQTVGRLVDELHTNSEHGVVDEHYAFRQRTFHSKWVEQASSEIYYYGRRHNSKLNSRTADRQAGSVLRDDICDFQAATRWASSPSVVSGQLLMV